MRKLNKEGKMIDSDATCRKRYYPRIMILGYFASFSAAKHLVRLT